jgi:hypothetical protein
MIWFLKLQILVEGALAIERRQAHPPDRELIESSFQIPAEKAFKEHLPEWGKERQEGLAPASSL